MLALHTGCLGTIQVQEYYSGTIISKHLVCQLMGANSTNLCLIEQYIVVVDKKSELICQKMSITAIVIVLVKVNTRVYDISI